MPYHFYLFCHYSNLFFGFRKRTDLVFVYFDNKKTPNPKSMLHGIKRSVFIWHLFWFSSELYYTYHTSGKKLHTWIAKRKKPTSEKYIKDSVRMKNRWVQTMFELSNKYSLERTMYCTLVYLKLSTCIVRFLLKKCCDCRWSLRVNHKTLMIRSHLFIYSNSITNFFNSSVTKIYVF